MARTKIITAEQAPPAAKAAAKKLAPKVVNFGRDGFQWTGQEALPPSERHVMRFLLLCDALHDFGDKARAGGIVGDVYLRKTISEFPGCPGVWSVREILVGFGVRALSDIEGELKRILTSNCPELYTGTQILRNTANTYYAAGSPLPPVEQLPSQFDIEKSHARFKELIEGILQSNGVYPAANPYYYADAGPGIGEKIGVEKGCTMRTTSLDSATASDGLTGADFCIPAGEHVFGRANLPVAGPPTISLSGNINRPPFDYTVSIGEVRKTFKVPGTTTSGPSLPFLGLFIRDSLVKKIVSLGGPKNAVERKHMAVNNKHKETEYQMWDVLAHLKGKISDSELDNYAFNIKTYADSEQPREAESLSLKVGGTLDGEEALQIILNGHLSLYKHTIDGKSSVTVSMVPLKGADLGVVALNNAKRNYINAIKDFNFYVKCCKNFETFRNSVDQKVTEVKAVAAALNVEFTKNQLVTNLVTYVVKMYEKQLIDDIRKATLPDISFDKDELLEDIPPLWNLEDLNGRASAILAKIDEIEPSKFLKATKVLEGNHQSPSEKMKNFVALARVEYGADSLIPHENINEDISVLKTSNGRVKAPIDKVLRESVLKGLFAGTSILSQVLLDIENIKKAAVYAADTPSDGETRGSAAAGAIEHSLYTLISNLDKSAPQGGGKTQMGGVDYEPGFLGLYQQLAEKDNAVDEAYARLESLPVDAKETITDEEYETIVGPYLNALDAMERVELDIEILQLQMEAAEASSIYERDITMIGLFMTHISAIHAAVLAAQAAAPPAAPAAVAAPPAAMSVDAPPAPAGPAAAALAAAPAAAPAAMPVDAPAAAGAGSGPMFAPPGAVSRSITSVAPGLSLSLKHNPSAAAPPPLKRALGVGHSAVAEKRGRFPGLSRLPGSRKKARSVESVVDYGEDYDLPGAHPGESLADKYGGGGTRKSRHVCSSCGHHDRPPRKWKTQRKPRRQDDGHQVVVEIVAL